jgi:hypothetical protein
MPRQIPESLKNPLEVGMTLNEIIIIACIAIAVWWPIGGFINRRRGRAWLEWLQTGLREVGAKSSNKWLRSFQSVGQLTVSDLRTPFQSVDVLFTLENRDNLIMWVIRHLQGRRDEMIVQASFQGEPVQELEVGYHGKRSYDAYLAQQKQKDNPFIELGEQDSFRVARRGSEDHDSILRLRKFLAGPGKVILRMSLQRGSGEEKSKYSPREDKNLLLRADMTRMDVETPAAFFAALREWAAGVVVDAGEVENLPQS